MEPIVHFQHIALSYRSKRNLWLQFSDDQLRNILARRPDLDRIDLDRCCRKELIVALEQGYGL